MDTMRVSSYIIPTQVDDDKYLLVHGYTGAIDIVGKEIGEFMQKHEGKDIEWHHSFTKEYVGQIDN